MYVVQPPSSPAILLHEKDDLCSLVKYPSKSRERHLQKISLDERYVSRTSVMLFFIFSNASQNVIPYLMHFFLLLILCFEGSYKNKVDTKST